MVILNRQDQQLSLETAGLLTLTNVMVWIQVQLTLVRME